METCLVLKTAKKITKKKREKNIFRFFSRFLRVFAFFPPIFFAVLRSRVLLQVCNFSFVNVEDKDVVDGRRGLVEPLGPVNIHRSNLAQKYVENCLDRRIQFENVDTFIEQSGRPDVMVPGDHTSLINKEGDKISLIKHNTKFAKLDKFYEVCDPRIFARLKFGILMLEKHVYDPGIFAKSVENAADDPGIDIVISWDVFLQLLGDPKHNIALFDPGKLKPITKLKKGIGDKEGRSRLYLNSTCTSTLSIQDQTNLSQQKWTTRSTYDQLSLGQINKPNGQLQGHENMQEE